MGSTVRNQKSGDQLTVGDWLAPGELLDGAAEVLHALAYRPDHFTTRDNERHVHLVVREQGKVAPYADVVGGGTLFDLASEADLAELREQTERQQLADELRGLALLILNPAMPVPQYGITMYGSFASAADVRAAAEVFSLPVESREPNKGIQTLEWPPERKSYEKGIHLHWLTIADEPEAPAEPAPVAEHYQAGGWKGDGPGTCGIECACGVTYDGFDSLAEAKQQLDWHIADPSGQNYGRADTAKADDPTPIGGRVPAHFADGTTGVELVDETLGGA